MMAHRTTLGQRMRTAAERAGFTQKVMGIAVAKRIGRVMTARSFTKTFQDYAVSAQNYEAASSWCHAHKYTPVVRFIAHTGACTITLEGEDALRAIEADTKAKAVVTEDAA
jgi:hypothetical protein